MSTPAPLPPPSVVVAELPFGAAWAAVYPLIAQLRPHLREAEFLERVGRARAVAGYALYAAAAAPDSAVLGVAGVRRVCDLLHGPHLYVDDLVVDAAARSRGVGARLLAHVEAVAAGSGALGVRLSTGIGHRAARRFYAREGWRALAVTYKKGFGATA